VADTEIIYIPEHALSEWSFAFHVMIIDGAPKYWMAEPSGSLQVKNGYVECSLSVDQWERRRLMKGSPLMDAVQKYVLGVQQGTPTSLMSGVL
jgi:hypothetical protein